MHLNQIRYFISVATYKSFTKAAEVHFLTQTAITQQIKALEDSIGTQLIDRKKRPIELTPAGKVFFQESKAILSRMDDAVSKAKEASTGAVGTIRIGYEKGYERSDLSTRLREFHRAYPNILFTCIREDTDMLAEKLKSNDLDIIFAWDSTNLRSNPEISHRLDMRSQLVLALYAGHPFASRKTIKREVLKDESILFMSPSSIGESVADAHFIKLYEDAGFTPKFLIKSNDIESLLMMVDAEEGVTIVPSYSIEKLSNIESLIFIPLEGDEEYEEIFMMWKNSHSNSALQCLLDFFNK